MDPNGSAGLILPDSRLLTRRTVRRMEFFGRTVNAVRVYCANCGVPYGWVPEESCTFACWLCNKCATKWGAEFGRALMPEEVFWRQVRGEMLDKFGRILTLKELWRFAESACGAFSKLIRGGAKR
jgi:hypothetical protein